MTASPSLPPLYFDEASETIDNNVETTTTTQQLPAELLHRCLVEYADWGQLARLAAVQTKWSNIMYDAASSSSEGTWELAQALLNGTSGLERNPAQAMKLLRQLTNVPVNNDNTPVIDNMQQEENNSVNEEEEEELSATTESRNIRDNNNNNTTKYAPAAMKLIAECYLNGNVTNYDDNNNDVAIGLKWMEAAHIIGKDLDAAHDLAMVYEYGTYGVAVDVVEAVTWFRKAAVAGHTEAMAELGLCYELGLAVEQSDEEALEWYMRAAEKGHLTAKYSVGEAFEEARGVPQSDAEACLWYFRAAVEGDEDSRKALQRLEDIARIVLPGVGRILGD